MATLTIRNIDEALKASLRVQAARHGQSMEEEVRAILRQALMPPTQAKGLGSHLVNRFRDVAGELPLPERSLPREPAPFDLPE
jgi:plasmid stability protein